MLLDEVRTWLRIKSSDAGIDAEINQVIAAALLDLKTAGVKKEETDPLIQQAVKLYAKAYFGYDGDSERFERAYKHLKAALSLSGLYNGTV